MLHATINKLVEKSEEEDSGRSFKQDSLILHLPIIPFTDV
jgi:hypothetical protein